MSITLETLFNEIKQRGISIAKFSKQIGIPEDRVYQWKKGNGKPKAEDAKLITDWLSNPVINSTDTIKKNEKGKSPETQTSEGKGSTLEQMTVEALRDMAASARIQSQANLINADKDLRLTALLETNFQPLTKMNDVPERLQAYTTKFDALQELLFELIEKKFQGVSKSELNHLLGKKIAEKLQQLQLA